MNKVKCAFCGKEYEAEGMSAKCVCGQRARLLWQRCVVCGEYRYSSSTRHMCASCAQAARGSFNTRPMAVYVCKCGNEFKGVLIHARKCPVCGLYASRTRKICEKCGKSFVGGRTTTQCPDCAEQQRIATRSGSYNACGYVRKLREPSPDQALAIRLCETAPKAVHRHIWQIIYRYPDVAQKIAAEAKTAAEAQQFIDDLDDVYLHERSSFGVASYG